MVTTTGVGTEVTVGTGAIITGCVVVVSFPLSSVVVTVDVTALRGLERMPPIAPTVAEVMEMIAVSTAGST